MANNKFGLSALMESMKFSEEQDRQSEIIIENAIGEDAIDEDIKDEFLEDEISDADIDAEIDRLSDDPAINAFIDGIPDDLGEESEDVLEEGWASELDGLEI